MKLPNIAELTAAGQLAALIHQDIREQIAVGVNILELEQLASTRIKKSGMKPAFLGYKGYPAVTCISINDEVVHGIPRDYQLQNGDVVKVDLGVDNNGSLVDTARTHLVGQATPAAVALCAATSEALEVGIDLCQVGTPIGTIGHAIERVVKDAGFAVIRDLTGHGVGPTLQEPPSIANHGVIGRGATLVEGQVIALEPITSLIPTDIMIGADNWVIKTVKRTLAAHFEHTLIVTESGPIVLTADPQELLIETR